MLRRLKILLFLFVLFMWLDRRTRRQQEPSAQTSSGTGELREGESIVLEENAPIILTEEAPLVRAEETPGAMAEAARMEVVSPESEGAETSEMDTRFGASTYTQPSTFEEQAAPPSPASPAVAQQDDLTVIEGIGSQIAEILQNAGIRTFQQLAETERDRIQEILRQNGLMMMDPTTWGEQAQLAANGDWDGLRVLQEQLNAGRRV